MQTGTWKAAGMLALAALAGGFVGSAITARSRGGDRDDHGHGPTWYIDLLDKELTLTPVQHDSVRAILDRRAGSMDSILAEMRPRIEAARQVIRSEINGQLTPAQQQQYRALTDRLDAERKERQQRESKQK